ncbi:hypothetical protein BJF79_03775 [Actinomadura sp. CNU-125]|uniref:hypothetical protein n=1 Tax=Actinomadura sp. CNU-125 TaxID=1904961 RepID=UPI00095C94DA|nr:hypothetical protein [Actinomadura sp. CNU-125]OLT13028.1 hypothetical protein BJF79_03775 [Actinomadura sp. CNU-125]
MNASERAAQLRTLADQHEAMGALEVALDEALAAYRAAPSEETKNAYTKASENLRAARVEARGSGVMVASGEPGSVTIGAPKVGKAG